MLKGKFYQSITYLIINYSSFFNTLLFSVTPQFKLIIKLLLMKTSKLSKKKNYHINQGN